MIEFNWGLHLKAKHFVMCSFESKRYTTFVFIVFYNKMVLDFYTYEP